MRSLFLDTPVFYDKDLVGALADWLPEAARTDEINYVKFNLGNLYHELCHRYIHADAGENRRNLRGTCKGLFFLIQNLHYLESGIFAVTKKELSEQVSEEDRAVLGMADMPDDFNFDQAFASVFNWLQHVFERVDKLHSHLPTDHQDAEKFLRDCRL